MLILTLLSAYAMTAFEIWFIVATYQASGGELPLEPETIIMLFRCLYTAVVVMSIVAAIFSGFYGRSVRKAIRAPLPIDRTTIVFKNLCVPFGILQAIILVLFSALGYLAAFAMALFPFMPLVGGAFIAVLVSIIILIKLVIDYLVLVATSTYSIPALQSAFRFVNLSMGLRVLFVFLQFIPFADAISFSLVTGYLERKNAHYLLAHVPQPYTQYNHYAS